MVIEDLAQVMRVNAVHGERNGTAAVFSGFRSDDAQSRDFFQLAQCALRKFLFVRVDIIHAHVGMDNIHAHEKKLTERALRQLKEIPGLRIIGPETTENRGGAISFTVDGVHPHDLGQVLDDHGVSIRVGHHCAWPLHRACGAQSTARASFYLYNTEEEVDKLVEAIKAAREFFGVAS